MRNIRHHHLHDVTNRRRVRAGTGLALALTLALIATACGNSTGSTGSTATTEADTGPRVTGDIDTFIEVDQPGVTDETIRIAGVASETNPLGGFYGDAFDGVEAYVAMVNDEGGVYQRQIEVVNERDDAVASNQAEVQGILAQDDVFAVLPIASLLFTGAPDLVAENVPTFGWNIQAEWASGDNLFGEKGSYLCFDCPSPSWPYIAGELGLTKVGILAYGVSAQSTECADGWEAAFEKYPTAEVVFKDSSLPFGVPDVSGEVAEMKEKGVDLILTCMDQNGVVTVAREANRQDLGAIQFLSNAYDERFVEEFGDLFEGSIVGVQFWPFEETTDQPEGMADYLEWIETTGGNVNELSMAGWLAADLFVTGLLEAGPDFSRQKVIDGINQLTDWNANGLNAGWDWTIAHDQEQPETCFAMLEVGPGEFTPVFGEPGKPFVCIDNTAAELPDEAERRG